jgi:uncharacterized protein YbjT (DUF2867 family)
MESQQDLVLVTGVTGKQGGAIARELVAKGVRVRGMTRHPDSTAARAIRELGVEIVAGDFDDETSVGTALAGAWGAYSVQNTWEVGVEREEEQGKRFAKLAREAGVQHLVYSSVASAHRQTGIPHFENKWRIEQTIRDLGFPTHVVLRPVFFMENLTSPAFLSAIEQGKLAIGMAPTTPLQMIAVADIGKYGAWAFDKHRELNGRGLDIAGDQLTMLDTARLISAAAQHPVEFFRIPIEQVRAYSADTASMLEWFDRTGYNADIAAKARESGVRPTTFKDWAARAGWKSPVAAS